MLVLSRLALAASLLLAGSLSTSAQDSLPPSGQQAKPFTLVDHKGESISLEDCRGDVALLLFHSEGMSYSRHLVEELAAEIRLLPKVLEHTVLLVIARGEEDLAALEQQLDRGDLRYRIIPDPAGAGVPGYGVVAYPTVFCIGPDLQLTDVVRGYGPHAAYRVVGAARFALGSIDAEHFAHIQKGLPEPPPKEKDPGLGRALTMVDKLLVSGQLDSASETLSNLGARLDSSARGLALLARVLLLQGHAEEAHASLDRLAVLEPEGEVRVLRIRLHIMEGEFAVAQAELDRLPGDRVETRLLRGMLLESQERWQEAALLYRDLLERLIREQH